MRNLITSAMFAMFFTCAVHAQEAVPATGGEATGAGGSSSYTVGQVVYTTNTANTGSLEQGV